MTEQERADPDFDAIIPLCLRELSIKFPEYGNSWLTANTPYWIERISNEVEEYEKSMTVQSKKRKLLNIINMCAMAWDNYENKRIGL